jgi:hypothetical protein
MERDQRPSGWRSEPDQLLLNITLVRAFAGDAPSASTPE